MIASPFIIVYDIFDDALFQTMFNGIFCSLFTIFIITLATMFIQTLIDLFRTLPPNHPVNVTQSLYNCENKVMFGLSLLCFGWDLMGITYFLLKLLHSLELIDSHISFYNKIFFFNFFK